MEASCTILGCLLLFQMTSVLVLLNPINDVRKTTKTLNSFVRYNTNYYYLAIAVYFGIIVYLGMYVPLYRIHELISSNDLTKTEKLEALYQIEKTYFIAGFSLFMFVVLYGVRALISYAATLLQLSISTSQSIVGQHVLQEQKKSQVVFSPENILPNLLRVKRSVSYETILYANELREQLMAAFKLAGNQSNANDFVTSNIKTAVRKSYLT